MRIAAIQMNAGRDIAANGQKALALVHEAIQRRAQFIVLPEVFMFRGELRGKKVLADLAQKLPGSLLSPFMKIARQHQVWILAGSVYEQALKTNKFYNTSVLINPQGKMCLKYRKKNLFDARVGKEHIQESKVFLPGYRRAVGRLEDFNVGLSICFDLRFPDLYRQLRARGADIFAVPSVFTQKTGEAHWHVLLRARAIENQCYVIAPNQIGPGAQGVLSFGHSLIIDPWGQIVAEASGDKEEVITAMMSRQVLLRVRQRMPCCFKN